MYKISKEFHFSAAHKLYGLPEHHPCSRLHGHNYVIIVHLKSDRLDDVGFVRDYNDLDDVKKFIDTVLDHKYLNSIMDKVGLNSTAENIAKWIFDTFEKKYPEMYAVEVKETPKTNAIYEK